IARGVVKHVLQASEPFFLTEFANTGAGGRTDSAMDPLRTQCAQVKGGHFAVVAPTLVKFKGDSIGQAVSEPAPTITAGGACKRPAGAAHALGLASATVAPVLMQAAYGEGKPGGVQRWGDGSRDI